MTDWPAATPERPTPPATPTGDDPLAWLYRIAPDFVRTPPADHHQRLWAHVWQVQRGVRPTPYVLILARGGAKSTTAELAAVALLARETRHYVWYVSRTQDQADQHVESIGGWLEGPEIAQHHPALGQRLLSKFGYSEGWRVNRLRVSTGGTIDAIGLDKAARGRRVGTQRPDVIILDDIDEVSDSADMTHAILDRIRLKILPAGTPDVFVLAVQNLISAHGVFARLCDGSAGILTDAVVDGPHPALRLHPGQASVVQEDGTVDGLPTWIGQDVAACNAYVQTYGLPAFLSEAQHEVAQSGRYFTNFDPAVHVQPLPARGAGWVYWAALDYGFDHPLAFGVFGRSPDGERWLLAEHVAAEMYITDHCLVFDRLLAELGIRRGQLAARVAGSDLFAKRNMQKNHVTTLADEFAVYGWHFTPAQTDRITGWRRVAEWLGNTPTMPVRFCLSPLAPETARQLATLTRDPKRPEDAQKINARNGQGGDDAADMCRYGVLGEPPALITLPAGALAGSGTKGWTP